MAGQKGTADSNGNGNGDSVVMRPTTLLLNMLERQAISETQLAAIISEQDEARASRRLMHQKLDDARIEVTRLGEKVETTSTKVDAMAPQLAAHERIRQNAIGGLFVLGALISVALLAAGFVLKEAWGWVSSHLNWK